MRSLWPAEALAKAASRGMTARWAAQFSADRITNARAFAIVRARHISQPGARRTVMAKGQMRSNKEKKKPKADKNLKKGGATPSPFSSGKMQMSGQNLGSKKS
jgi:hypothetical protein